MIQTGRSFLSKTRATVIWRGKLPNRGWPVHVLFAVAYVVAVWISMSAVYSGTFIAVAWPPLGMAVWWAVSCHSWRALGIMSLFVFAVPVLQLKVILGNDSSVVILAGLSYVIAGPGLIPVMALLEKLLVTEPQKRRSTRVTPFAHIVTPGLVYRLLVVSLIMIPIAKSFSMLGFAIDGYSTSANLYLSLVLRDLAGVIAIAGPGIAIASSAWRGVDAAAIREFIGVIISTAVLLALIFGPGKNLPIMYLAMLPLYWSATRFPVSMAAIHAVVTSGVATFLAYLLDAGPFATSQSPVAQASEIQIFIIMCILLSLVVSSRVQQQAELAAELEVLTKTIPDALLTVDRKGQAIPVNDKADALVVQDSNGKFVMRDLRKVDGALLTDSTIPSGRALKGETVRETLVELADVAADGTDNDRRIYSVSASPFFLPGGTEPDRAVLLYHDSTDEYRAMKQLQRAHDEARYLFEYAPQGVATLDETGMILQANRALGELVGVPADQLSGRRLDEFSAENSLINEVNAALEDPNVLVHADRCLNSEDGYNRRVALSFRTMAGEDATPELLLVNAVDVTERQRLHELVSHLADHDSLTGLINRRRIETELEDILERSVWELSDGAVLLIDLDNFKLVNNSLGHQAGDDLLVEFASVLRESTRSTDAVGRIGGDEFLVILPDTDPTVATAIGERIVEAVQQRFKDRPNVLRGVTTSIGISMFLEAREQGVDPLQLADQLLYDAKNSGRNRLVALKPGGEIVWPTASQLSKSRLEEIMHTDALTLELQPIAEIATGRIVLAEALIRVVLSGVPVATGEFVTAVERAGLGPLLDECVLRKGIKLLPELQRARPGFRLALNLSGQSVGSEVISRLVVSELETHRVPSGSLVLEVTETAPIEDVNAARDFGRTLREHGVELAIDDFGAGFEPYRYLKQLDFDILKIPGEFVEGLVDGGVDLSIVRSLIYLSGQQGMSTVAEFVSDERIFHALQPLGVTYVQGYHIGSSLPLQDFITTHLSKP